MNISKVALDGSFTNSSSSCTIDSFKQVIYPIMYLLIFFLGGVGNSLSIYVFFQTSQSTSVNIYMQNLAISDLMLVSTVLSGLVFPLGITLDIWWYPLQDHDLHLVHEYVLQHLFPHRAQRGSLRSHRPPVQTRKSDQHEVRQDSLCGHMDLRAGSCQPSLKQGSRWLQQPTQMLGPPPLQHAQAPHGEQLRPRRGFHSALRHNRAVLRLCHQSAAQAQGSAEQQGNLSQEGAVNHHHHSHALPRLFPALSHPANCPPDVRQLWPAQPAQGAGGHSLPRWHEQLPRPLPLLLYCWKFQSKIQKFVLQVAGAELQSNRWTAPGGILDWAHAMQWQRLCAELLASLQLCCSLSDIPGAEVSGRELFVCDQNWVRMIRGQVAGNDRLSSV